MSLVLNIYNPSTKEIAKQYTAETVDIMFGTVEDIIKIISFEKLNNKTIWAELIAASITHLKPLLKDVFAGVTDEEIKHTKITELVSLFKEIFAFLWNEITGIRGTNNQKN